MTIEISHSNTFESVSSQLDISISNAFFNQSVTVQAVVIIPKSHATVLEDLAYTIASNTTHYTFTFTTPIQSGSSNLVV